jgi:hypothetical protein
MSLGMSALLACAVCAQQTSSGVTTALLVAFIAAPFAVAGALLYAIRHVDS